MLPIFSVERGMFYLMLLLSERKNVLEIGMLVPYVKPSLDFRRDPLFRLGLDQRSAGDLVRGLKNAKEKTDGKFLYQEKRALTKINRLWSTFRTARKETDQRKKDFQSAFGPSKKVNFWENLARFWRFVRNEASWTLLYQNDELSGIVATVHCLKVVQPNSKYERLGIRLRSKELDDLIRILDNYFDLGVLPVNDYWIYRPGSK